MNKPTLILDSRRESREALARLFSALWPGIRAASDWPQAVRALDEHIFGLAVVRYGPGEKHALEFLAALRSRGETIPSIILADAPDVEICRRCFHLGASDYLPYNGDTRAILEAADRAMAAKRQSRDGLYPPSPVKNLDELHFGTLYTLSQMIHAPETLIKSFTLEQAVALTGSRVGFLYLVNAEETEMTLHAWSKGALEGHRLTVTPAPVGFAQVGPWGVAAQRREPYMENEYRVREVSGHGYPPRFAPLRRFLSVPVADQGRLVAVAGVGDKREDYDAADIRQVSLLFDGMRRTLEKKQSDEELRRSLTEKELLLQEVHHRVKNNLQIISSMLNLTANRSDSPAVAAACRDIRSRIHSMALIHSRLYRSVRFDMVDVSSYVRELYAEISTLFPGKRIAATFDLQEVFISLDLALPCSLTINEALTNVFKHAFPDTEEGLVAITLRRDKDGQVLLRLCDNGCGLPEGLDLDRADSLGLKLIRDIVRNQLHGALSIEPGQGTCLCIEFNAAALEDGYAQRLPARSRQD